jgi:hypothetical protein
LSSMVVMVPNLYREVYCCADISAFGAQACELWI